MVAAVASVGAAAAAGFAAVWSKQGLTKQNEAAEAANETQHRADAQLDMRVTQERERDTMWRALDMAADPDQLKKAMGAVILRRMRASNQLDDDDKARLTDALKVIVRHEAQGYAEDPAQAGRQRDG